MIQCLRPNCGGQLVQQGNEYVCTLCAHEYEMVGGKVRLLIAHWEPKGPTPIRNQHGPRAYMN